MLGIPEHVTSGGSLPSRLPRGVQGRQTRSGRVVAPTPLRAYTCPGQLLLCKYWRLGLLTLLFNWVELEFGSRWVAGIEDGRLGCQGGP